jgi:hypothetical protein
VRTMLAAVGVTPEHEGKLIVRKRVMSGKEGWFFFNPTDAAVTEKIVLNGWRRVCDLFGQPVPVLGEKIELTVAPLDVRVLILEERV